jgi:site-specific recombinase XerD
MGSIKFVLRPGKKVKGKEYSIYLLYSHKGDKTLIATDYKAPFTLKQKQGNRGHSFGGFKPEDNLEDKLGELKKEFREQAVAKVNGEPEAYRVREAWTEYKQEQKTNVPEAVFKNSILARWDEYLSYMAETLTPSGKARTAGTIFNNRNSRAHLLAFLDKQKRQSLKPEKFTLTDFQKFDKYLTKEMSPNSVSKTKKHFKSFLKWHLKNGGRLGFNVSLIEYAETAGVKIALSEKELATIAQTDFNGGLNLVRDLMLLQASTGVRVSDLQRLCDNLNEDKTAFKIRARKTGKDMLIPISALAKTVLVRNKYKMPRLSEQKYREGIKRIYQKLWPSKTIEIGEGDNMRTAFVWEEISSHDMVRTFVNIAWKKGLSVPTIATLTGKTVQVLLKNYLNEDKDHAAQEMLEKFDLSPLRLAK